jgi:Mg/Co/Ni transporter MgtE
MVLGLNESVSTQSMTLTIQALRLSPLSRRWFLENLRRESVTALLLGGACGAVVGLSVWLWRHDLSGAFHPPQGSEFYITLSRQGHLPEGARLDLLGPILREQSAA